MASSSDIRFYLLGERAAVIEIRGPGELECQRRIWWMAEALRAGGDYTEIVLGMNNLTVVYDPSRDSGPAVLERLSELWSRADPSYFEPRDVTIPVHYGGDTGPDLEEVARHTGLAVEEVVALHSGADYIVYFLGFQPGFAYLGGLPAKLAMPRRAEPRVRVPAGSVGIGSAQTGIYPAASPGGWQLIGRTRLVLFDPGRAVPSLLLPGDRVRFVPEPPYHA